MYEESSLINKISISTGDIPANAIKYARSAGLIAWDIETSGLDWNNNEIGTCQIYIPPARIYIILVNDTTPRYLKLLLKDKGICKVFHHAMFDLRFMTYKWSVKSNNVCCTKIASKILDPWKENHSLKAIIHEHLGVEINKKMQRSDWLIKDLSNDQIMYAARDVLFLPELFSALKGKLIHSNRWELAEASFSYLPIRAYLDIIGCEDVYKY